MAAATKPTLIPDAAKMALAGSILAEINQAVRTITIECRQSSSEKRARAIEFLARASRTAMVTHTLSDVLRRFSHALTDKEKIKIAELLMQSDGMAPITKDCVRSSLESALQKEVSLEVGEALQRLYHKVCE